MKTPIYDIAISGSGPVGSALALILAAKSQRPERIALLGRHFASPANTATRRAPDLDPRALALNHGSRILLERLGAWPAKSASIETVHVSQRGRLGRALIRHSDLNVPRLGNVVGYDTLLENLHNALQASGVSLIEAAAAQLPGSGSAEFDVGDRRITASIAIQSDGARPSGVMRQYGQDAVLATVRASRPRTGWAFERFTRAGPLAFLPHPQENGLYAVVWCCPPDEAARLLALDDAEFAQSLREMFGDRLGSFKCAAGRHVFPLSMHAGPSLVDRRTVAIGNAAQTLHPVAGQGLNLGLRDAEQLGQALAPWLANPQLDPQALLARYAGARRPDRWLTAGITDLLPRVFSTGNPIVEHAVGLALLTLDLIPAFRNPLARQLLQGLRT